MANNIISIIKIGSNMLNLKITQKLNNKIEVLEEIEHPVGIGKDTFSKGKISFEKINKICEIVNKFIDIAKDYNINKDKIIIVATSAIRESSNKEFLLDQLRIKSGVTLDIIDDSEEKLHNYKNIYRTIEKFPKLKKETSLIAYISSGSLGVALYQNEKIIFTQNILIGSLKLNEILSELKPNSEKYYIMINDYLNNFIITLKKFLPTKDINNFIITGRNMKFIAKECKATINDNTYIISRKEFINFYDIVKENSSYELIKTYNIREDKSQILLPSIGIYKILLDLTSANHIIFPPLEFIDSIIYDELYESEKNILVKKIYNSTIETSRKIGEKYLYNEEHASFVENLSLKIFDKLKDIHFFSEKDRIFLQVASILHDVGKFINIKNHYEHSYNIIKNTDIIGLSISDMNIIANIVYYHSQDFPNINKGNLKNLEIYDKIVIAKLLAILRISDSLDKSHKQNFKNFKLDYKNSELNITVKTNENTSIDEWNFNKRKEFTMEVFGIKINLRKKKLFKLD